MTKKLVCSIADVPLNGMTQCISEGGLKLLVANSGDEYFAYNALCPHQEVELCEGMYDGCVLTCHQHLWQWDIKTGGPIGLAEAPLEKYEVQIEAGNIYVVEQTALKLAELFAGLSPETLDKIAAVSSTEPFEAGATLYNVGDPASDIYVLENGRINFAIGRDGSTIPDGFVLRKGEVFGWNALLDKSPHRIAAATCLEKSSVTRMNGEAVLKILEADPAGGFVVMRRLSSLINRYLSGPGAQ